MEILTDTTEERSAWLSKRSPLYRQRYAAWKRAPGAPPRVLGHRGACRVFPENTLPAFTRALEEGADGVELDVRMTSDGELIIAHDPAVPAELTDQGQPVEFGRLSASQVAALPLPPERRIPTLREVLDWQRETNAWLNVELKGDVPSQQYVVRAACALLANHDCDRILISSFYPLMLLECSLRLPDVPTAWLVHAEQRWLKTAPGWRWTRSAGVHPQCLDLPMTRVQELLRAGALVNVWTVNDPHEAARLARLGVDGLITDVPGEIVRALRHA